MEDAKNIAEIWDRSEQATAERNALLENLCLLKIVQRNSKPEFKADVEALIDRFILADHEADHVCRGLSLELHRAVSDNPKTSA